MDNSSDRNSGGSAGSGTVYTDNADTDNVDSAGRYTRQTVACSSAGNGACANVVAISFYDGPYE
ncbi:MAG: hypothetical protein AAF346_13055 [Pseudomonadota bacterium]